MIDAFFQKKGGHFSHRGETPRSWHEKFLAQYGLTNEQVPLLDWDNRDWKEPFQAAAPLGA